VVSVQWPVVSVQWPVVSVQWPVASINHNCVFARCYYGSPLAHWTLATGH